MQIWLLLQSIYIRIKSNIIFEFEFDICNSTSIICYDRYIYNMTDELIRYGSEFDDVNDSMLEILKLSQLFFNGTKSRQQTIKEIEDYFDLDIML